VDAGTGRGTSLEVGPRVRFALLLVALAACEPPGYGRHGIDAATDGTHGDGKTPGDAAADSPSSTVCSHLFELDGHGGASTVWLTGDFIAWGGDPAHGATALTLGAGGAWTGTRDFTAGTYLYKFIVDGSMWIPDPNNPVGVDDGFGGHNSVYDCMP
jgi:hypothetical protein